MNFFLLYSFIQWCTCFDLKKYTNTLDQNIFFALTFPPDTTGKRLVEDLLSYNGNLYYIHKLTEKNDTIVSDIAKYLIRYEGPMFIKPWYSIQNLEIGFGWSSTTTRFVYDLIYQSEQLYNLIKKRHFDFSCHPKQKLTQEYCQNYN